jgi:hypothetical protein
MAVSTPPALSTELARIFEVTQPAVSIAVKRGQTLADTKGWRVPEE